MFNLHGDMRNVKQEIIYLPNTLYDYFRVRYGTIKNDDPNTAYQEKYSNISKRNLKKTLGTLKQQSDDRSTSEIRCIFKLIRSKYTKKSVNIEYCSDDKRKINK